MSVEQLMALANKMEESMLAAIAEKTMEELQDPWVQDGIDDTVRTIRSLRRMARKKRIKEFSLRTFAEGGT